MLKTRVIAAAVFAPALFALVWWGAVPLGVTCLVLCMVMLWELMRLVLPDVDPWTRFLGHGLGLGVALCALGWVPGSMGAAILPVGTMLLLTGALARPEPVPGVAARVAALAFCVVYCCGLLPYLARLREVGMGLAFLALLCTWAQDTGAYFTGRLLGRHKLYPRISPGKTVEGAVGGVACAVGSAYAVARGFSLNLPTPHVVALGVLVGVVGIVGDLVESMLKRSVGAKDSSGLIPGHGGVLDRFDAVMFAAPMVYAYVTLLGLDGRALP